MGERIISGTGGSRGEAIVVLFDWSWTAKVTTHSPSSVEEEVVAEETGELCRKEDKSRSWRSSLIQSQE